MLLNEWRLRPVLKALAIAAPSQSQDCDLGTWTLEWISDRRSIVLHGL